MNTIQSNSKNLEVNILGQKFKTVTYLRKMLPGRFEDRPIALKTIYQYLDRGMPHFKWGGKILFSDQDLGAIPNWISENCRRRRSY